MSEPFKYFGQTVDGESMFFFIKRDHQKLFYDIRKRMSPDGNAIMDKSIDTIHGMTEIYADFNQFSSRQKIHLFLINEYSLLWMTQYDSVLTKFLINNHPKMVSDLQFPITAEDRMLFVRASARREHAPDSTKYAFQSVMVSNNVDDGEQALLEQEFWDCLWDRFDFTQNKHMIHTDNYTSMPLLRFQDLFGYSSDDIPHGALKSMLVFVRESKMWSYNVKELFRLLHSDEDHDRGVARNEAFLMEAYTITMHNYYERGNLVTIPTYYRKKLKNDINKMKLIYGYSLDE